jgi:hypothetical protein
MTDSVGFTPVLGYTVIICNGIIYPYTYVLKGMPQNGQSGRYWAHWQRGTSSEGARRGPFPANFPPLPGCTAMA